MAITKSCKLVRASESQKDSLSSDCGLQPAHMKSELLVIADQHAAATTVPGLVHTARHAMGAGNTQSRCTNRKEEAA